MTPIRPLARPFAIAAALLLLTGCVVHSGRGPAAGGPPTDPGAPSAPATTTGRVPIPPPPPPTPRPLMTQPEAEQIALRMAADRAYQNPHFHQVQWKQGHYEWKIDLRGDVDGREAKLQMRIDARDGRIVELKDKRGGKPEHAGKKDKDGKHGKGHEKHGDGDDGGDDDHDDD